MVDLLQEGKLPIEEDLAWKIAAQGMHFSIIDGILYYLDSHKSQRRAVVSVQLLQQLLEENHRGFSGGHFATKCLYTFLIRHWWNGMYADVQAYVRNCPECTVVTGGGMTSRPTLHPIPFNDHFRS